MGGGVVKAQGLRLDMELFVRARDLEFLEVRVAVQEFLVVGDSVVFHPDIGIVEAVWKPANMRLPVADQEVIVVRAVSLLEIYGICGGLCQRRGRERCS